MESVNGVSFSNILFETEGPIAYVTLDRPEKRNALSLALMHELTECFDKIGANRNLSAVILKANGPAFSAGHDIQEMIGHDVDYYRHVFDVCTVMMEKIQAIPQPVIAQVHAIATAAGCQLAATCDLAIASDKARFATPGVRIGLFCSTPMVAVSRNLPRKKMLEMLFTGEAISAQEALLYGLVNHVVPAEQLESATRSLAERIVTSSPYVIGLGKQAFYRQLDLPQPQAYAYAKEVMSLNAVSQDAQEGMCAFTEKRPAHWHGA